MFRPVLSSENVSTARLKMSGIDENEPISEITPALVQAVADLVYARLLADSTIDRERRQSTRSARLHSGGWR